MVGNVSNSQIEGLFSEVLRMHHLSHPHLMNVAGVCLSSDLCPMIIMPFMSNGSLLDYIKKERTNLYLSYDAEEVNVSKVLCKILHFLHIVLQIFSVRKRLLKFCHQIALGMNYLSMNRIVHRDLAARNCL